MGAVSIAAAPLRAASLQRVLVIALLGLFAAEADAQQEAIDMHLEDVGFIMRAATPQQFDRLRSLPARRFIARTVSGRRYYLYADPDLCKCVFLGSEMAMQSYQDLISAASASSATSAANAAAQTPAGQVLIEEMNDDLNRSIAPGDFLDY